MQLRPDQLSSARQQREALLVEAGAAGWPRVYVKPDRYEKGSWISRGEAPWRAAVAATEEFGAIKDALANQQWQQQKRARGQIAISTEAAFPSRG